MIKLNVILIIGLCLLMLGTYFLIKFVQKQRKKNIHKRVKKFDKVDFFILGKNKEIYLNRGWILNIEKNNVDLRILLPKEREGELKTIDLMDIAKIR